MPPGAVGTHLWLLQVFNSGVRRICGRIFIWTVDYFLSWSVPPQCVSTHLWLLQVFNSGVRGIWGWIFIWTVDYFLSWSVFEPGSFGSSVWHSTTVPPGGVGTHLWLLQVFNSGVRGICGRIFIWTVDYFLSWSVFEPGTFGSSVRQSTTVPPGSVGTHLWLLQVFNSGVRGICGRIFIWTVDYFLSWSVPPGGVGTPTSDYFRLFFVLISIWTRDLWIFSPILYHCATGGCWYPPLITSGI